MADDISVLDNDVYEVPDVDPNDTRGMQPDVFTWVDVAAFYKMYEEKWGITFIETAATLLAKTKKQKTLHLTVRRKDPVTYTFTVRVSYAVKNTRPDYPKGKRY